MILTHLIAFGIIGSAGGGGGGDIGPITDIGTVIASAERTAFVTAVQSALLVSAGAPLGAQEWRQHFDPADHAPYALDFTALLDSDEQIAEIELISMSALAALLGVGVDTDAAYGPIIDTAGKKVQVWFETDEASWQETSFSASGVQLTITFRVVTDSTPPKRYERTGVFTVRQQ